MLGKLKIYYSVLFLAALLLAALMAGLVAAQGPDGGDFPAGSTNPTTVLYQGYIVMDGTPYDGNGYFKFAIVNAAGNVTYWSNDGTSTAGGPPNVAVPLQVNGGYFTVLLGDISLSGMTQALNPAVFAETGRYLRVWFAQSAPGPFTTLSLVPIAAVPYALNAETLDGYDSNFFQQRITTGLGLSFTDSTLSVNTSTVQSRVTGVCADGNAIRVINADGSVTCEPDDGTSYEAGTGITIVGTTLNVDTATVQSRVTGVCADGHAIRTIGTDGTVTCEATGGGDITAVYSGNGLTGGGEAGSVTMTVAFAGSGSANTVARSDHDHDGVYAPVVHDHLGETWIGSGAGLVISSTYQTLRAWSGGTAIAGFTSSSVPTRATVYGGSGVGLGVEGYSIEGIGAVGESITGTGIVGVAGYPPDGFIDGVLRDAAVGVHAGVYGWSDNGPGGYFTSTHDGVYGISYDWNGVVGVSTGGDVADNGVYGETNSTSYWEAGVYGYSSNAASGVRGVNGGSGTGVYGYSNSSTGVYGSSSNGTGVYGYSSNDTGVYGYSSNGTGVYGRVPAGTGFTYGVIGGSASDAGTGVLGWASAYTATNVGVYGYAAGIYTDTRGVMGYASASSGNPTWGVYGRSDSNGGAGVMAYNFNYGTGLRAQSYGGDIIQGYSGYPFSGGEVLRFYVDNSGNISTTGNIDAAGTKSAIVSTADYGARRLYAVESTEVWFEDFGSGQLLNGEVTISFDPVFAQTVNLTETYHVFLTPLSNEAVLLFVTDKSPTSFTVHGVTLDGQPADAAFDYRITAKRLEYENVRLEPASVHTPRMPELSRPKSEWTPLPPLPERPETLMPSLPREQGR